MSVSPEHARKEIVHLYYRRYLVEHYGLLKRHDVSIALEFLVWLETFHPTLLAFSDSAQERFRLVREWLKIG